MMAISNVSGPFLITDFPRWARQLIVDAPEGQWTKLTGTLRAKYHYSSLLAVYMACEMDGFLPGPMLLR